MRVFIHNMHYGKTIINKSSMVINCKNDTLSFTFTLGPEDDLNNLSLCICTNFICVYYSQYGFKELENKLDVMLGGAIAEVQVTYGAMQLHNRCAIFNPSF